ncbi:hypothetical protein [Vreelandella massiliensis]|uniref:hypothetical protein n=1 Tax=Vreelandella massiliensis TaxID=1816686 RepID=UPI00096AAC80|nr:hypothetical protein [Halomonas massiliensis]MYL22318.1 hypothetical protein [Halomonas alkaliantarctica]
MQFLCPMHRQHFARFPLEAKKDLWLRWMENARTHSEQGQWREVIALAGSAFELACLEGAPDEPCLHIELTLSAILLSGVLADHGDSAAVERVIYRALSYLQDDGHHTASQHCCGLGECVSVLIDHSRQAAFFADYLNWPSLPFGDQHRVSLAVTFH